MEKRRLEPKGGSPHPLQFQNHTMHRLPKIDPLQAHVRRKFRRNRKLHYPPGSVVTDDFGNILDRPLTEHLPCFANPIEQLWGRFDEPRTWGDKEPEPRGCAMCPVSFSCRQVVWQRIEKEPKVRAAYYAWERVTCELIADGRHSHPTWTAFVTVCEATEWADSNDSKLREQEEAKVAASLEMAAKKSAANRRQAKPKPKSVPSAVQAQLQQYRDARVMEMEKASENPKAPLWLRNRKPDRRRLVADAWQGREMLERGNLKSSASAVLAWLTKEGRLPQQLPAAMVKRVAEAIKLADELIADGIWPDFDPPITLANPARPAGLHPSAVVMILDD